MIVDAGNLRHRKDPGFSTPSWDPKAQTGGSTLWRANFYLSVDPKARDAAIRLADVVSRAWPEGGGEVFASPDAPFIAAIFRDARQVADAADDAGLDRETRRTSAEQAVRAQLAAWFDWSAGVAAAPDHLSCNRQELLIRRIAPEIENQIHAIEKDGAGSMAMPISYAPPALAPPIDGGVDDGRSGLAAGPRGRNRHVDLGRTEQDADSARFTLPRRLAAGTVP